MQLTLIFKMGSGGHLVFMQITRVALSCHLGHNAEFVLEPYQITNHHYVCIEHIGVSNRLFGYFLAMNKMFISPISVPTKMRRVR